MPSVDSKAINFIIDTDLLRSPILEGRPGASDKPSDNDPRQRQTEHDPLRRHPLWPAVIRPGAMPSDETFMHGKEKVYGSIP